MAARKSTAKTKKVTKATEAKVSTGKGRGRKSKEIVSKKEIKASSTQFSERIQGVNFRNFKWQKKYWWIVGVVLVVIVAGYLAATKLVIAWVDNKPITFFQYYGLLDQQYGSQLKAELISQQLVLNEADKRHVSVTDQEINDQINTIKQQTASQGDFNQLLSQQGLTLETLKQQIKLQLLIKKMFGQGVSVSDSEVNDYIAANKDQFPQASASAQVQVKNQLTQQKIVSAFQTWLSAQQNSNRVIRVK